jgi:hypothetical protein
MKPGAQSLHAAHAAPLIPAPAAWHEGVTASGEASDGTHEGIAPVQPAFVW